eukprot:CAMPEP_0113569146 /NCGR_PEP_ID=MMETSP0015_2-20120614/24243_1 /TAXON_ID=2838 /ORGANISM="Odontella" /LENGTH=192 /DNA_ID=CAMNT_0000471767 /DNA_START=789 /DNA_END=1364 /DNA_ORIENTATION=- /assembly_acc=CAM_ASM_000160
MDALAINLCDHCILQLIVADVDAVRQRHRHQDHLPHILRLLSVVEQVGEPRGVVLSHRFKVVLAQGLEDEAAVHEVVRHPVVLGAGDQLSHRLRHNRDDCRLPVPDDPQLDRLPALEGGERHLHAHPPVLPDADRAIIRDFPVANAGKDVPRSQHPVARVPDENVGDVHAPRVLIESEVLPQVWVGQLLTRK